jgi:hypothetical protein
MFLDWAGIVNGLLAAVFMAAAFIASTAAVRRTPGLGAVGMLANAVVPMSLLSIVGIACLWQREFNAHVAGWLLPVLSCLVFWFSGQGLVFFIQRRVDSSQVVPLLGLKLPVLALISIAAFDASFNLWQFVAILLTVAAAFILNNAGRRVPLYCFALVLLTCVCYSLSDLCLNRATHLIAEDTGISLVKASALNTFLTYTMAGICGAVVIAAFPSCRGWRKFCSSAPHGIFWVASIVFLCVCFARLGPVNGNIVQSTRSFFAILAAPILVWLGVSGVETRVGWRVTVRRLIAAGMMIAAVALYNHS